MPFTRQKHFALRFWISFFFTLLIFDRWTVYNTPLAGLDGSWAIAIQLVHQSGLIHGTEFVFTYGPLSWLVTRLPIFAPEWAIVLFDALWLANIIVVMWLAVGTQPGLWRSLVLLVLIVIHKQCASTETPFWFYFFVLFYLAYHLRTNSRWALAVAIGLAVLTFYLKANVGLISLLSVTLYGISLWATDRLAGLVTVCGMLVVLGLSTYCLPVDLYPFLVAQWHLIDSYNDVMYVLQEKRALKLTILILALTVALFIYAIWRIWQQRKLLETWKQDGLLVFLVTLQLFVLFKEGFVRADAGHISLFFKYALLPFGLITLFCHTHLFRRIAIVPIVLIALTTPLVAPYHWEAGVLYQWLPQWIAYGKDIMHPQYPSLSDITTPWPHTWLTQLRNKRVDIIPYDISLLYANQLHYTPRPVIQTYQVTDTYLDSLNATYFLSSRAPDYVLLTMDATDNRDPFADETRTKLALLQTYQLSATTKDWLLLQRRAVPLTLTLLSNTQMSGRFNEQIDVPSDSTTMQLWQIKGTYRIGGILSRMLFQPPRLTLELTYQTGERAYYRTALPLVKDGLLFPLHCRTPKELSLYWQSAGKQPKTARIKSFRILTDYQFPVTVNPSFAISQRIYRLSANSAPNAAKNQLYQN
ncbi:hypothetical protein WBJ53_20980 [Spirosoma sp. SC4-14]|uniref:hypothetical protein n=1 Tax=Spirosoma sp. SC4-14 TaxID=3128900 RepID=UPI0030CBB180